MRRWWRLWFWRRKYSYECLNCKKKEVFLVWYGVFKFCSFLHLSNAAHRFWSKCRAHHCLWHSWTACAHWDSLKSQQPLTEEWLALISNIYKSSLINYSHGEHRNITGRISSWVTFSLNNNCVDFTELPPVVIAVPSRRCEHAETKQAL